MIIGVWLQKSYHYHNPQQIILAWSLSTNPPLLYIMTRVI